MANLSRLDAVANDLERQIAETPARTPAELHAKAVVVERVGPCWERAARSLAADVRREGSCA